MPQPRWPVVVLDLDGTLADDLPLVLAGYEEAWRQVMGTEPDWGEARRVFGTPLLDTLRDEAPADRVDRMYEVYRGFISDNIGELCRPQPGVSAMVRGLTLGGITLGVATSLPRAVATTILEFVGLSGLPVLGAFEDVKRFKPSPEVLERAFAVLDCDPRVAVYVGDSVHDVQAAKAAGCASVAVTWGAALRADLAAADPDAIIDDPDELLTLVLAG